jgi:hypothetical protein
MYMVAEAAKKADPEKYLDWWVNNG